MISCCVPLSPSFDRVPLFSHLICIVRLWLYFLPVVWTYNFRIFFSMLVRSTKMLLLSCLVGSSILSARLEDDLSAIWWLKHTHLASHLITFPSFRFLSKTHCINCRVVIAVNEHKHLAAKQVYMFCFCWWLKDSRRNCSRGRMRSEPQNEKRIYGRSLTCEDLFTDM